MTQEVGVTVSRVGHLIQTDPPRTRHGPATDLPRRTTVPPRPITDHGSQYSHDVPPLGIIQQLSQLQEELNDPLRDEDINPICTGFVDSIHLACRQYLQRDLHG